MRRIQRTDFRVVVEPRRLGNFGLVSVRDDYLGATQEDIEKEYRERCAAIVSAIKRHVDGIGNVSTEYTTEQVCSYCGRPWTESSSSYNGGCCEEDERAAAEKAGGTQ